MKMEDNPLLRHQSLTILQQIEELKKWHKQQQLKTNQDKTGLTCNRSKIDFSPNIDAGMQSNINHANSPGSPLKNFDEIPIRVTNPNFVDIVENNVPPIETRNENQEAPKPKFKFLKRGEGIARFRMGPQKIQRKRNIKSGTDTRTPNLKLTLDPKTTFNSNGKSDDQRYDKDCGSANNAKEIPPLHPPDLQLNFKDWKSIFDSGKADDIIEKAIDNNRLEIFQPNSSLDSSTASIMEKLLVAGRKHLKDKEELRVFEAIEHHIQDTSFCSTSSYVTKLMENAVMSTPEKTPHLNKNYLKQMDQTKKLQSDFDENKAQNGTLKSIPGQKRSISPSSKNKGNKNDSTHESQEVIDNDELQHSLHVRFSEEVDCRSFVDRSQSVSNIPQGEDSSRVDTFNDSEEWKQDSEDDNTCCSQCSTSYSSSEEDVRAISLPVQHPVIGNISKPEQKYPASSTSNKRTDDSQKLLITDLETDKDQQIESTSCKNIDFESFPPVLSEKLKQLEDEIEIFRLENSKLKCIREKLEKEQKTFMVQKKKLIKDLEEEKKANSTQLEAERQKLAKEKFIFEKYSKGLSKNPSREERKEIQALREQLKEMKEELNKKESRWGAAQARVRNQVKLLEEDNKKLRGEIEILTKKAKHLELMALNKKGKFYNNTKLIHAVSEHISALPVELDTEKVSAKLTSGYFNSKTNSVETPPVNEINKKECDVNVVGNHVSISEGKGDKNVYGSHPDQSSCKVPPLSNDGTNKANYLSPQLGKEKNISTEDNGMIENNQPDIENLSPNTPRQVLNDSGTVETVFPDGKRELRYKNGNVKKLDPIIGTEKTIYFNGDVKEITANGTVKYYFSESRIWHTTLPDGLEVFDFPNGQVEKRHKDGLVEIVYPNNCKKLNYADGSEVIYYPDGTTLKTEADKRKVLSLPNGQKEIHTEEYIRREYPDGTSKIVYADGTTETVYSNGRVRLKDKHGNLVMDSATSNKDIIS